MDQDSFNYTDIGAQNARNAAVAILVELFHGGPHEQWRVGEAVDDIVEASVLETLARIRSRLDIEG